MRTNAFTPDELDEELGALLMTLTFFASLKFAKAFHQETNWKSNLEHLSQ